MNDRRSGRTERAADAHPRLRATALVAVVIGVMLLAAAAFVLSYTGIHQIALSAGVAPVLARLYPPIFDAMLVTASAAALALRGAGWWTRTYVWFSLLVLLAAVAAGDAVHAIGLTLPRKPSEVAAAVIPWALLLLAFVFLLAMLRQFRRSRAAAAAASARETAPGEAGAAVGSPAPGQGGHPGQPGRTTIDALLEPRPVSVPASTVASPPAPHTAPRRGDRLVASAPPGGFPVATQAAASVTAAPPPPAGATESAPAPAAAPGLSQAVAGSTSADGAHADTVPWDQPGQPAGTAVPPDGPAAAGHPEPDAEPTPPAPPPHFDRLHSTPTPPAEQEHDQEPE
jgi:Protein of unknown function (DUF2637)